MTYSITDTGRSVLTGFQAVDKGYNDPSSRISDGMTKCDSTTRRFQPVTMVAESS